MKTYNIPVEATLEVIGGKWKVVILCHLKKDKKRTCELKQLMSGITQKMLTQQLRELEEDGVIERKVYNQVPPKSRILFNGLRSFFRFYTDTLCNWGENHLEKNGNTSMLITAVE
ncbi:helix-turn-helix domain-containing protein [Bacillus cereus]